MTALVFFRGVQNIFSILKSEPISAVDVLISTCNYIIKTYHLCIFKDLQCNERNAMKLTRQYPNLCPFSCVHVHVTGQICVTWKKKSELGHFTPLCGVRPVFDSPVNTSDLFRWPALQVQLPMTQRAGQVVVELGWMDYQFALLNSKGDRFPLVLQIETYLRALMTWNPFICHTFYVLRPSEVDHLHPECQPHFATAELSP